MKRKYHIFVSLLFVFGCFMYSNAQVPERFQQNLSEYLEVNIDVENVKSILQNAPLMGLVSENRNAGVILDLPKPSGGTQQFRVVEAPMMSSELSSQLPDFKSYVAQGIDDPTASARFNITPVGFYGVIKGIDGISIIEQIDKASRDNRYITYYDHNITSTNENVFCETDQLVDINNESQQGFRTNSCFQNGANLRSYDMIVTCSGEFYQLNGNSNVTVQAALLARVAQINAIYEPELAITFVIVEYLLNSNPATDPFTSPTNTSTSITQAQTYINANASVPFDIGHGFHEITCGGSCGWAGRAGVGVVCTTSKALGYTYLPNDIPTAVTVLLHEIGHMFSSYHTNYGCNSENNCERFEPGQGSSIMSTGAGCDAGDFFASRTDYFGIGSLQSMFNFTSAGTVPNNNASCTFSTATGWTDCSSTTATGNNLPSADANANSINGLTIPHSTPFTLSGTGSDLDGLGSLTYNWEQYDTDYANSAAPDDTGASTTAPQFRSFPPSTSNTRTCPQLSSVLAGNVTTGTGEVLPTVARTLTWRLVVRDNVAAAGGIACDEISLNVGSDGPFQITSQNTVTAWVVGSTQTVTWDVANTDMAAYTCSTVDILYSSDGGTTFGTTLASNVTNDGSQSITAPAGASSTGRIKIVCNGGTNIFFDINNIDIAVVVGCSAEGGTLTTTTSVTAPEGDPSLNLSLCAGVPITSVAGVLDAGDSNSNLAVDNLGAGTCIALGNNPKYETMEFSVAANASVTFTRTFQADYNSMIALYQISYDPNNECTNWLNSNGNFTGTAVNIATNFSEALVTGTKYVLLPSAFSSTTPTTGNYNVAFSQTLYATAALTPAGYLYTYAIVNTGTGNIVAFDVNSDLTDSWTYPAGSYAVYGLSYLAGSNLSTYTGNALTSMQTDIGNSTLCGDLSTNSVTVTIQAVACTNATWTGTWDIAPQVPYSNSSVIIASNYDTSVVGASIDACTVMVNAGVTLTIEASDYLKVKGNITVAATGSLVVKHLGSLVQVNDVATVTNSGTITVEKTTPTMAAQSFMISGSPMTAETRAGVFASSYIVRNHVTTNFVPNTNVEVVSPGINNWADNDGNNWLNHTGLLNPGEGYLVFPQPNGTSSGTYAQSHTLGTLNNGIINFTLGFNTTQNASPNMLANPYASAIDAEVFFDNASNSGINVLYFWEHNTAASAAYPGYSAANFSMADISLYSEAGGGNPAASGGATPTRYISSGQGFGVKPTAGGTAVFNNAQRVTGPNSTYRANENVNRDRLWLNVYNDTYKLGSTALVAFTENTSDGFIDSDDVKRLATPVSLYSELTTGEELAINTLAPFEIDDQVNMSFVTMVEEMQTYRISLHNIEGPIIEDETVYLIDNQLNIINNLSDGDYTFTSDAGTFANRFTVVFENSVLGINSSILDSISIYPNPTQDVLTIDSPQMLVTAAVVYDIRGRKVSEVDFRNQTNYQIDMSKLEAAIYFVKIATESGTITKRVIKK